MAEILLSLTIIGVVAAITLPSLTCNINERTWNTQRKALYARMSQAISLMPSLNGYGILTEETDSVSAVDTVAETFITDGLSKVLKINNVCDNEHLTDCGLSGSIIDMAGNKIDFPKTLPELNDKFDGHYSDGHGNNYGFRFNMNTKAAAFETVNGESVAVYYHPTCKPDMSESYDYYVQPKMCVNFIYDLNGNKGPNTVGKDIGTMTAFYPVDPIVVAPAPLTRDLSAILNWNRSITFEEAGKLCKQVSSDSRVPNKEEVISMFYNKKLFALEDGAYWSGTVFPGNTAHAWYITTSNGYAVHLPRTNGYRVRCIMR